MFCAILVHCAMQLTEFLDRFDISLRQLAKITDIHYNTVKANINGGFSLKHRDRIKKALHRHYGEVVSKLGDVEF
jgi:plasmid maintenance system antidote protein VapI